MGGTRQRQWMQFEHRGSSMLTSWEELHEPGAYVEEGTGDLFRVPARAVGQGGSPLITKVSHAERLLVRVSDDPAVPLLEARITALDHNIEPNF